jgi:hypothetical protein
VGIRTGPASGLLALDIDPRNGGSDTLAVWERTHGSIPFTLEAVTGGGGRHFLFQYPAGRIKSGPLAAGIDLKGEGGYIVAARAYMPAAYGTTGGKGMHLRRRSRFHFLHG